jgi:zinc D-Ala-D-Ala carboxypeptidase
MTWRYFKIEEFSCHHCGVNLIDHGFVDKLHELRERVGFPLIVNSGYRCPAYNKMISDTGETGPHTTGHAVDFKVDRKKAYAVLKMAVLMGFTGIGVAQKGSSRYLHLDDLLDAPRQPRPTIWSY